MNKPIAIISASIIPTINYMHERVKIKELNKAQCKIIDENNQVYYIFINKYQMRGYEFSDVWSAPGSGGNPNYIEMYNYAKSRIR